MNKLGICLKRVGIVEVEVDREISQGRYGDVDV
jgi:hypothetical protein